MSEPTTYTPPKVWTWNKQTGGQFASINRPIAGPTHEKKLPVGEHALDAGQERARRLRVAA